jgi:hypothetical protein
MINDPNAKATDSDVSGLADWIPPDNYFTNERAHDSQDGYFPDAPNPAGDFSPDIQVDPGVYDINVPIPDVG